MGVKFYHYKVKLWGRGEGGGRVERAMVRGSLASWRLALQKNRMLDTSGMTSSSGLYLGRFSVLYLIELIIFHLTPLTTAGF